MPHKAMLDRIRAEYMEMPGLRLTLQQVQRLCGVEQALCQSVLDTLVDAHFLCVKADGGYARVSDGADRLHLHPAKAHLGRGSRTREAS